MSYFLERAKLGSMVKIGSEKEFRSLFRPIDRDEVQLPADLKFPMLVRGTFAWVEAGGVRTYLVFEDVSTKVPRGIVFRRTNGSTDVPATMCDFCHAVRGGQAVGMLTVAITSRHRVGVTACRDLSCQAKLDAPVPGTNDLRETFRPDQKRQYLLERISEFAKRYLFKSPELIVVNRL
jgi:hypothetical protein